MARDPKIEVGAINLRIPQSHNRNYPELISMLAALRKGVQIRGESFLAISHWDPENNLGVFSKYTEIDVDGEWFDLDDFDAASPERVDQVKIPASLKPNLSQFYFTLKSELHVVAFEVYSDSKGLSARSVEKFFEEILQAKSVIEKFGRVECDMVKSYSEIERILDLPDLKELRLIIKRPNSDDVGKRLAHIIEERLRDNGGDEYEEAYRARGTHNLEPTERTKALALVAAENGQVKGKSLVNGVMTDTDTKDRPLTETTTFKADLSGIAMFRAVAGAVFEKISKMRASLNG
jgi:Domain of unknown function (DUF4747)